MVWCGCYHTFSSSFLFFITPIGTIRDTILYARGKNHGPTPIGTGKMRDLDQHVGASRGLGFIGSIVETITVIVIDIANGHTIGTCHALVCLAVGWSADRLFVKHKIGDFLFGIITDAVQGGMLRGPYPKGIVEDKCYNQQAQNCQAGKDHDS